MTDTPARGRTSRASLRLIVAICGLSIAFDGYDLTVYGTTVPSLLKEWDIGAAQAGTIGSYALVGMLIGALVVGTVTDVFGRRRVLLGCITWFSVLMALCALAPSPEVFGGLRFLAGLGLGGVMPTASALVIEYAPQGKRNFTYVFMQSGYAVGGIVAAALAIPLIPAVGWQVMYLIGAAPLVLVLPLAVKYLPESLEYLVVQGRHTDARALADRLGVAMPQPAAPAPARPRSRKSSLSALFARGYAVPTILFWLATFCALLLVYGLNTWLPQLMRESGYALGSALSFLLVFNLGSIVGSLIGGRAADRFGSKPVIFVAFILAAVSVAALSGKHPMIVLYILFAVGGYGTIGTQNLINAFVTGYYPLGARATGIGWSLGVGRLGALLGPLVGGLLISSGLGLDRSFFVFASVAVIGALIIAGVRRSPNRAAQGGPRAAPRPEHQTN